MSTRVPAITPAEALTPSEDVTKYVLMLNALLHHDWSPAERHRGRFIAPSAFGSPMAAEAEQVKGLFEAQGWRVRQASSSPPYARKARSIGHDRIGHDRNEAYWVFVPPEV
jgi:hypothetical protein